MLFKFINKWLVSCTKTFKFTKLSALTLSHNAFLRGLSATAGGRLSFRHITPLILWKWAKAIIVGNVLLSLGFMITLVTLAGIKVWLIKLTGSTSWLDYIPLSLNDVASVIGKILSISLVWTLLVSVNHLQDLVGLITQLNSDGSVFSYIATIYGYLYVINIDMGTEFIKVLLTNPSNIVSTRGIHELILFTDTIQSFSVYCWGKLIVYVPSIFEPYTGPLYDGISYLFNSTLNRVFSLSNWIWGHTVGLIQTSITPSVPLFIQPVVDSIFHKVASFLGATLIIWIIRILFGF
jgi:hypothetical protein